MVSIGVRELKQRTSEIINIVREKGNSVLITRHGKVIAKIVRCLQVILPMEVKISGQPSTS